MISTNARQGRASKPHGGAARQPSKGKGFSTRAGSGSGSGRKLEPARQSGRRSQTGSRATNNQVNQKRAEPQRSAQKEGRIKLRTYGQKPALSGKSRNVRAGELGGDQVEGRRAVRELLAVGRRRTYDVWIAQGQDSSPLLDEIEELARRLRVPVETVPRSRLDMEAKTEAPQGVLAHARPVDEVDLEELTIQSAKGVDPFLLVVAGVTDPRNLGALLRSAECAGVTGIVLPRHRCVHLSPTVTKVAAGAVEHLSFAMVAGIPSALEQLHKLGVWSLGLAGESELSIYNFELGTGPIAIVVGSEGKGIPELAKKRCDLVVGVPQHGALPSLNVGVAGAVAFFEVARQRAIATC